MGKWLVVFVMGALTLLSFYGGLLGLRMGDGSAYFFVAAGFFCGIVFAMAIRRLVSPRGSGKSLGDVHGAREASAFFVPHWFMLAAIIIAAIGIVAAILVPKLLR